MIPERNRRYQSKMIDSRRERNQGQRMRKKRKQIVRVIMCLVILSVSSLCSFLLGKIVGEKGMQQKIQVSVKEEELLNHVSENSQDNMGILENSNSSDIHTEGGTQKVEDDDKEGNDKTVEDVLLVNRNNRLPEDYEVQLKTLPDGVNRAAKEAYQPLCDMLNAGRKEGLNFEVCSSYRDVERQRELFDEDMERYLKQGYSYSEAYEKVAEYTMPPGYSEHSTGLSFDIVALDYQMLNDGQEKTEENKWLRAHCAEYGFILRYPKDKEDITDIKYESWHFRYVGKEIAEYIMENGITLEEYLEQ